MHPTTKKRDSLLAKFYCNVFGHRFKVSRHITHHITEYKCAVCQCETTTDVKGDIIYMTPERKEINETLALFYEKRQALRI